MNTPRLSAGLLCAAIALTVTACGSSAPSTTTIIKEVPAAAPSASTTSAAAKDRTSDESSDGDSTVSDEGTGGKTSGRITVPSEVGKNHQAAQDDMQAHGLYNLSEEDATGQGRMLILDRNWKVVSQSPAAGTKVSEDATVTLRSKKYTDG
jgi:hypothetical protein